MNINNYLSNAIFKFIFMARLKSEFEKIGLLP